MKFKNQNVLGIITARGGSKEIPRKNIKKLAGKPLIQYTFDAVRGSNLLDRCILSSEDEEIIRYSKKAGMEVPFKRPKDLALDSSKSIDVLIHALKYLSDEDSYNPNYVMTLQPTSPLRNSIDIDESIKIIMNNNIADSLVSVIKVPHNFNPYSIMILKKKYLENYLNKKIIRRQELPNFYARNGAAIYITKTETLLNNKEIIGGYCLPYFMPEERSIDIDNDYDWRIAELLIKNNIKNSQNRSNNFL
ncbi:MAG: acylneuraminate cytidylyltransferase family protein [Candidatus Lokiarchaeota archaeon]|nr:acylneuraminate cytidylyltransferase family protein [Candidatus Lokiarchaeota archaeon]